MKELKLDEVSLAPHFSEVVPEGRFVLVTVSTVCIGKPLKRLEFIAVACGHLTKVKC
jgi:hypothetical protein